MKNKFQVQIIITYALAILYVTPMIFFWFFVVNLIYFVAVGF